MHSSFNTTVDIKLKQWAEKQLPQKCVEVYIIKFILVINIFKFNLLLKGWNQNINARV